MRSTGIYNRKQLAMLSKTLEGYCLDHSIERSGPVYDDASYLVLALFRDGAHTVEELKLALAAVTTGREKRQA
jgi:hypothetical protein